MKKHTRNDSNQATILTPGFVDRYSIVGPADACVARLEDLSALGIEKVVVIGPSAGSDRADVKRANETMRDGVLSAYERR